MTAEQLEELLGKVTQGEWFLDDEDKQSSLLIWSKFSETCIGEVFGDSVEADANATLIALAPSLARRVLAAEKLVEALGEVPLGDGPLARLVTAYREASK